MARPRLVLTSGEPAGIGPDLILQLASDGYFASLDADVVVLGDQALLTERAAQLGLKLRWQMLASLQQPIQPGLSLLHVPLASNCRSGQLDKTNARYVLSLLDLAIDACVAGNIDAMVTLPVQKSVINDAGIAFSGHTEYLAERTHTGQVVMMLAIEGLRVALATTHLPLSAVPTAISQHHIETVIKILHADLRQHFGLNSPRIMVLGLNPHAGEGGHMGREEIDHIIPALNTLREQGMHLQGPLPADTAFNPHYLQNTDVVLAMYHDQGLPVLKYKGFGNAVNITLGLPIIRTSVDHGTALDLAGTGTADTGSLQTAIATAITMARHRHPSDSGQIAT